MSEFSNVPINFDDIPKAENIPLVPIEKKYLTVKLIFDVILWGIIIAAILGFYFLKKKPAEFLDNYIWYIVGACIVLFIINVLMSVFGFKWMAFAMREKDIIYRSGLIFRSLVHVPYNRVQHCEVNQGVIDRWLNLAKLKIYTAGGSKSDLSIPGLKNEDALKMKSFILKKTNEDESV